MVFSPDRAAISQPGVEIHMNSSARIASLGTAGQTYSSPSMSIAKNTPAPDPCQDRIRQSTLLIVLSFSTFYPIMFDMEQNNSFTDALFQAVMEKQQAFDAVYLPKLLEEFRVSHSATKTIRTVLIKKGVFHDDPFRYDSKIQDIQVPSDEAFADAEKAPVIGRRLSEYEAMLDYLNNYYQFTCDFLTPDKLTKLAALTHTFNWEAFSNNSNKPNTRALSELTSVVRTGTDPLSISIMNDALRQLSKSSIAIAKGLKALAEFHRERYKLTVRKMVMPGVILNAERLFSGGLTEAMREIKKSFAASMRDQPFYTELIEEILKEDYSPDHAVLQQELLSRLASGKNGEKGHNAEENLKPALLDGIRTLGSASPQLEEITNKIQDNHHVLMTLEKGFMQKLAALFRKAFNIPEEELEIYINIVDPTTLTAKRETIIWSEFIEELKKKTRIYTGFAVRTSASYLKIESMEEQQIFDLLTRNLAEIGTLTKQLAGLDEYFKVTVPSDARDRIRGIKIELSAIKNNLVKANQCRAEYSSLLEEQQQLKKLGITNA